jgi:hypothetical protein
VPAFGIHAGDEPACVTAAAVGLGGEDAAELHGVGQARVEAAAGDDAAADVEHEGAAFLHLAFDRLARAGDGRAGARGAERFDEKRGALGDGFGQVGRRRAAHGPRAGGHLQVGEREREQGLEALERRLHAIEAERGARGLQLFPGADEAFDLAAGLREDELRELGRVGGGLEQQVAVLDVADHAEQLAVGSRFRDPVALQRFALVSDPHRAQVRAEEDRAVAVGAEEPLQARLIARFEDDGGHDGRTQAPSPH